MRILVLLLLLGAAEGSAHVGSPDVFYEGGAGPYRLLVTVRPPVVVPGVAEIEIRAPSEVSRLRIVPMPLTGPGARFAPVPDLAVRSKEDPLFFTGSLWMMTSGSWQVRIRAEGSRGSGELSVPVPALASRTLTMQRGLGAFLLTLLVVLGMGAISIVGASVREGQLDPGLAPQRAQVRRSHIVMAITAALVVTAVWLGNRWWDVEAGKYRNIIFKPLQLEPTLEPAGKLRLHLSDPGWLRLRRVDDLIPDHNHLMHLYVLRVPGMERVWHLHPEASGPGDLLQQLPPMPSGRYRLFGDIVHQNGLPETVVAEIELPEIAGRPLSGDDSAGEGPPLSPRDDSRATAALSGGYRMVWERDPGPLRATRPALFRFRLEDAGGNPARDMELYMGMPGHAAFIRSDLSVFAHVHPSGSVPMASLALVQPPDPHGGHTQMASGLPAEVSFPYGFPRSGDYRIVVQMKRAGAVETGVFDARVED
jgi:hypothetical protein